MDQPSTRFRGITLMATWRSGLVRGPADDRQNLPNAEPHSSLCGPNHTTRRPPNEPGLLPDPQVPVTKFTSPTALSPRLSLLRLCLDPALQVLSSEFPYTLSTPSSHAAPGCPNSIPGSWFSRLPTVQNSPNFRSGPPPSQAYTHLLGPRVQIPQEFPVPSPTPWSS